MHNAYRPISVDHYGYTKIRNWGKILTPQKHLNICKNFDPNLEIFWLKIEIFLFSKYWYWIDVIGQYIGKNLIGRTLISLYMALDS